MEMRPAVMSIAGLDPSGGAGLLADIKTFEQLSVLGFGCCSAITAQTPTTVLSVTWLPTREILSQARPLLANISFCKIGIMPGVMATLELVRELLHLKPELKIVVDPVLKASAGYDFHQETDAVAWKELLPLLFLLTPNYDEAREITGKTSGEAAAEELSASCAVLLKGGHRTHLKGHDTVYTKSGTHIIAPSATEVFPKHGSGCILSAAITACLAKGQSLTTACTNGKRYTEKVLASHSSNIGYHHI
jgi:hydroxymethylpyrimidine/phosphomethylpyrimidine kinase